MADEIERKWTAYPAGCFARSSREEAESIGLDKWSDWVEIRTADDRTIGAAHMQSEADNLRMARLWAAAPELFEALEAAFNAEIIYTGGGDDASIANCGFVGVADLKAKIEAALAKARGAHPQAEQQEGR